MPPSICHGATSASSLLAAWGLASGAFGPFALRVRRERDGLAVAELERGDARVGERQLAAEHARPRGRRPADDRLVLPRREGELDGAPRRLLHLRDDVTARLVVHEDPRVERLGELELRARFGGVGDRHVALPWEVRLERDVLAADLRLRGRNERAPVRVPIGLVERDAPVAIGVGGATEPDESSDA
jgi:hypothetical protein